MRGRKWSATSEDPWRILEQADRASTRFSSRGTCKIYPPGHRERSTGGVARAIRITDSEKRSFSRRNVCVSANRIARWNGFGFASSLRPFRLFISLSLPHFLSFFRQPNRSVARTSMATTLFRGQRFFRNLWLSLSLSLSVWVRARAFRFPFQQISINGSCQNVTWLAGMDGGRGREGGVVAFCGHFAEHRYGKVRKARRDNWRMRILKLGFFSLSFFLFFLPFSNERDREQR